MAVSIRHWLILLVLNMWVLGLAYLSGIGMPTFMKRVWLVVPLFTGIIIFPSLFNFVRPGTPLLILVHFGHQLQFGPWILPSYLAITSQGVWGALVFILRVGACVSLALLLTLTTRWSTLLKSFNMIFVPQVFITILEMTYRYIYVFLDSVNDIFLARKSRTVGRTSTKEQRHFVSGAIGALCGKAIILSEEVHAAMVSRGYTGKQCSLEKRSVRQLDWVWVGLVLVVSVILLGGDLVYGL
jgi:cobalt/nickel transport system permease protein